MAYTFYILACSGPGAGQAIARSITIGYFSAAAVAYMTICLFRLSSRTGRYWPAYLSALLLSLHPAWTISAVRGDCGIAKVVFSVVLLLLISGLLTLQIITARRYK
jgi:hypothetical protein